MPHTQQSNRAAKQLQWSTSNHTRKFAGKGLVNAHWSGPAGEVYILCRDAAGSPHLAVIDTSDLNLVQAQDTKWMVGRNGYVERADFLTPGRFRYLHQVILQLKSSYRNPIDHKNHDRLDNRRNNLRTSSPHLNQINRSKANRAGYPGLTYLPSSHRWRVKIQEGHGNVVQTYHKHYVEACEAARSVYLRIGIPENALPPIPASAPLKVAA